MSMLARARRAMLLAVLPALTLTGCDDPLLIVGDLPGIMRRTAGLPNSVGSFTDSLALRTQVHEPWGLAVADDGTLFVADSRNARIVEVGPAGRARIVAAAQGCSGVCLVRPRGLALRGDALYIADPDADRVFALDLASGALQVLAGDGSEGDAADGLAGPDAPLRDPTGVAVADDGIVYFSERGGHRIRWLTGSGLLRTLAGTGEPGYDGDGTDAARVRLFGPAGMEIHERTLYFADEMNDRVRSVELASGRIRTIAGIGVPGYEFGDTIAVTAKLNRPRAVALSPDGLQLFIADAANHRVRVVNQSSGRISPFAGTGSSQYTGEGLDAPDTSLNLPAGLAVHGSGTLFVADTGHQLVWRTRVRF